MSVFVLGIGLHPPAEAIRELRLEEIAYRTVHAALADASVSRAQIDGVTLGACDELDGRPISSMLMSAPSGAYGSDEIKVTDSGATALCLAYARVLSGESELGLVVSWCKSSKTDLDAVMRLRCEPFYTRALGIGADVGDALFAQSVSSEFGIEAAEVNRRVAAAYQRAASNPRGLRRPVPKAEAIANGEYVSTPLRETQRAPLSDGAVALVIASSSFVDRHPECRPLARIAGMGWATDSNRFDAQRLRGMGSARTAWSSAMRQAGLRNAGDLDVVELETPTGYHEAAYARVFGIEREETLSPSGGTFAQNPVFCSGLVNVAEAALQVANRAGACQRPDVRWAAAHGAHGHAQQGNVVAILEKVGEH